MLNCPGTASTQFSSPAVGPAWADSGGGGCGAGGGGCSSCWSAATRSTALRTYQEGREADRRKGRQEGRHTGREERKQWHSRRQPVAIALATSVLSQMITVAFPCDTALRQAGIQTILVIV